MESRPQPDGPNTEPRIGIVKTSILAPGLPIAAIPSAVNKAASAGATRHLLVVDDEMPVRTLVKMMGEFLGYVVFEAANGAEALTRVQQTPGGIEVVITDVTMPVMDGLALVRALKKMPLTPAIAVMSGRFDDKIRAALLAEGVTVLMNKPFSTDDLGLTLSQVQTVGR